MNMENRAERSGSRLWTISILAALIAAVSFGIRTIGAWSIWGHLAMGRWIGENGIPRVDALSFTRSGVEWVDTSWLYERLAYALWSIGGASALTLVHVALVAIGFALLAVVARRLAGNGPAAAALLLCGWLLAPTFQVSPGVFVLVIPALYMFLLSRSHSLAVLLPILLVTQALWTNLHPSFLLGPIVGLCFGVGMVRVENASEGLDPRAVARAAAIVATLLVAMFFNPYSGRMIAAAWGYWTDPAYAFVQEWISPFAAQFVNPWSSRLLTVTLLLGVLGLIAEERRLPLGVTALAVVGAVLSVLSLRHLPLFAFMALPFLAISIRAILDFLAKRFLRVERPASITDAIAGLAALILAVVTLVSISTDRYYNRTGSASRFGLGIERGMLPEAAVLARADFPERFLHTVWDGGYLAWRFPERTVFVDQRAQVYGAPFFVDYVRFFSDPAGRDTSGLVSEALDEKWSIDTVVLNCAWSGAPPAIREMLASGKWAMAFFDGTTAILVKPSGSGAALLADTGLLEAGLQALETERRRYRDALAKGGVPPNSAQLIGAAGVFLALDRFPESEAIYSLLVNGAPTMSSGWLGLGMSMCAIGKSADSIPVLEQAIRMQSKNPVAWLWLWRALGQVGREGDAAKAYAKAEAISPQLAAAFRTAAEAARGPNAGP